MPPSTLDTADDNTPKVPVEDVEADDDAPGPPISVPDSGDPGEGGKLKMIIQLVKRAFGVKDIAAMRLSLPASLLEPVPNLEYWQYLDRPDLFAAVNDSEDPFERMLAVLRFTFSKELKFVHGKVCKPYNSVLGEHFRSHWDVIPVSYPSNDRSSAPIQHLYLTASHPTDLENHDEDQEQEGNDAGRAPKIPSTVPGTPVSPHSHVGVRKKGETASVKSGKSEGSRLSLLSRGTIATTATNTSLSSERKSVASTPGTTPDVECAIDTGTLEAAISSLDLGESSSTAHSTSPLEYSEPSSPTSIAASTSQSLAHSRSQRTRVRITFLTEQISHHPPISAFCVSCPTRHVSLRGIDQLSARISGTSLRVTPGSFNKGLFLSIDDGPGKGETYHISHPVANVNGLLRGSFYATIGESSCVTCSGGGDSGDKLRAIIDYKEESWLGRAQFLVEGIIHTYSSGSASSVAEWTRIKHVPRSRIIATFQGSWHGVIRWKRPSEPDSAYRTLIDLSALRVVPMVVRDLDRQDERESRKLWERVTANLHRREFLEATKWKITIEQMQREEAAERKRKGVKFVSQFFESDISSGIPILTDKGHEALAGEMKESSPYPLEDLIQESA